MSRGLWLLLGIGVGLAALAVIKLNEESVEKDPDSLADKLEEKLHSLEERVGAK